MNPLPRTSAVIEHGMEKGLHVGAQLYVALQGNVIANLAFGLARPGVPMTTDTLMLWMSSTKPVATVAIAQLWERGQITLDDSVSRHVPEFATHGKETVTIRHLLTHTVALRHEIPWSMGNWDEVINRLCQSELKPHWLPGKKAGYQPSAGWFMLGEIIRRVDGRDFSRYAREEIFLPLGMKDSWIGMSVQTYRDYGDRMGVMHQLHQGKLRPDPRAELAATICRPGGSGHGPIRELARFYEMLRCHGTVDGVKTLQPQTVEALTARHRVGMMDHTFHHVMDWGLGVMIDSKWYEKDSLPYAFGQHTSHRTFGHGGNQSSVAFCDPETGVVVAWVFNGMPGEEAHHHRRREISAAIEHDLGLG